MGSDKAPEAPSDKLCYRFPIQGFGGDTTVLTKDGDTLEKPQHVEFVPALAHVAQTLLYIERTAADGTITRYLLQSNTKGALRLVALNGTNAAE